MIVPLKKPLLTKKAHQTTGFRNKSNWCVF